MLFCRRFWELFASNEQENCPTTRQNEHGLHEPDARLDDRFSIRSELPRPILSGAYAKGTLFMNFAPNPRLKSEPQSYNANVT